MLENVLLSRLKNGLECGIDVIHSFICVGMVRMIAYPMFAMAWSNDDDDDWLIVFDALMMCLRADEEGLNVALVDIIVFR